MSIPITKTFTVTTSPDVMVRFEKLLCFLHYNGGHSGLFAIPFDGDGSDRFRVEPAPDQGSRDWARISDAGPEIEVANTHYCEAVSIDRLRAKYRCDGKQLVRVSANNEIERIRTYEK